MHMNLKTALGGIALASALTGASAAAVAAEPIAWDTDGDGMLEYAEWDTNYDYDPIYALWDTDKSGSLSNEEFGTGLFNSYDADGDGKLNKEEYAHFMDDAGDDGWLDI